MAPCCAIQPPSSTDSKTPAGSASHEHLLSVLPSGRAVLTSSPPVCPMTANRKQTIDEIHRRIGRNLLRYQGIEECLRLLLPYIHPNASAKGADAMRSYQQQNVASK